VARDRSRKRPRDPNQLAKLPVLAGFEAKWPILNLTVARFCGT